MHSRALGFAFTLLVLASGASCHGSSDVCADVAARIETCGFPQSTLACDRTSVSALESFAERLESRGCSASVSTTDDGAVDPRLCALADWSCPASPTPAPALAGTKYPVLFVSGIDDSPLFDWNPRILDAVNGTSRAVHVHVSPWASTAQRAGDLWSAIRIELSRGAARVNLVCYAVAGIDCRYLASPGGLFADDSASSARVQSAIASVTTVSTPHRGTRVAEVASSLVGQSEGSDVLAALVGSAPSAANASTQSALRPVLDALSLEAMGAFNARVVDAPGVFYQSFAGVSAPFGRVAKNTERDVQAHCVDESGAFVFQRHEGTADTLAAPLLATVAFAGAARADDGRVSTSPSDGMIAVDSAKWGHFGGCLPADHYDVIGQMGHLTRDPQTGFDAPLFYRWLAGDLAARGL